MGGGVGIYRRKGPGRENNKSTVSKAETWKEQRHTHTQMQTHTYTQAHKHMIYIEYALLRVGRAELHGPQCGDCSLYRPEELAVVGLLSLQDVVDLHLVLLVLLLLLWPDDDVHQCLGQLVEFSRLGVDGLVAVYVHECVCTCVSVCVSRCVCVCVFIRRVRGKGYS